MGWIGKPAPERFLLGLDEIAAACFMTAATVRRRMKIVGLRLPRYKRRFVLPKRLVARFKTRLYRSKTVEDLRLGKI